MEIQSRRHNNGAFSSAVCIDTPGLIVVSGILSQLHRQPALLFRQYKSGTTHICVVLPISSYLGCEPCLVRKLSDPARSRQAGMCGSEANHTASEARTG